MLRTCQLCEMFSAWPDRVSVPMMSSAAVEAMSEGAMMKLRSVCTAMMSLAELLRMTCSTHSLRDRALTPWML